MAHLLLLVMMVSCCYGLREPEWNLLKVTWGGFDCHSNTGYYDMPRTEQEAKRSGFEMLSDCGHGGDGNLPWAGKRYALHGDHGVVLIYDANGYIAGIQSGISADGFPPAPEVNHPFVKYDSKYYITFYTVKPEIICDEGRHQVMYEESGTGTHLFLQNGSSPSEVEEIPRLESDLQDTLWVKTSCLPTMGQHYRYAIRKDMDCDVLSPLFIAYTDGKLGSFGWGILADANATFFEHESVPQSKTGSCTVFSFSNTNCMLGEGLSPPEKEPKKQGQTVWVMTSPRRAVILKEPARPQLLICQPSNTTDLRLLDFENFKSSDIPNTAGFIGSVVWDSFENRIFASYWPSPLVSFAIDGSHKREISKVYATVMAIDAERRRLFYVDSLKRSLNSMNTDGRDVTIILENTGVLAIAVDVDKRVIYYIKEMYYKNAPEDEMMTAGYDGSNITKRGHLQRTSALCISREEKRWYVPMNLDIYYKPVKYIDELGLGQTQFEPTLVVGDQRDGRTIDDIVVHNKVLVFLKRKNKDGREQASLEKYHTSGKRITSENIDVPNGAGTRPFLLEVVF